MVSVACRVVRGAWCVECVEWRVVTEAKNSADALPWKHGKKSPLPKKYEFRSSDTVPAFWRPEDR
tara:strand:- start:267 stop:461 length:195 start_codon:yes stop_codon:yes gene_type:complete